MHLHPMMIDPVVVITHPKVPAEADREQMLAKREKRDLPSGGSHLLQVLGGRY